jgi:hypothetical protein
MHPGRIDRRMRAPRRLRRLQARRRLRQINRRRVQRALLVAPPVAAPQQPGAVPDLVTTYGAPRSLLYLTVKRDNTSFRTLYGHWWLELDDQESYGWWPASVPLRVRDLVRGTQGVLNGLGLLGMKGSWSRDPNHGQPAAHAFHPVLEVVRSDEQVRRDIRQFAHGYRTRWRWHWSSRRTAGTCRGFQDDLFAAVGLSDGADRLHTRGSGCPFLYQLRRPFGWLADRLDAPRPTALWAARRRILAGPRAMARPAAAKSR